ncbi:ATP-binding protein [Blastococcus sp. TF02A-26]|uniref:ATP-binding protein n=1 Tax=Blastococcus sp. TF02A-26 TaxID=2250577 RepID=UPI000DEA6912|nr:ATP-binding protein [Blastococcus sp. TF02A-26]RBY83278.1 histidine kinase [Blastococcus sp. TF02A-26]
MSTPTRLGPDVLRELFLFEDLDADQLAWVSANGDVVDCAAGTEVSVEGQPAECFFVLLEGTMTMSRRVGGSDVETVRTDSRGVYSGAVQFYMQDRIRQVYPATVRAVTDCRFLALPAGPFAEVFQRWYPMAVHLLEGLFVGTKNTNEVLGQRERLLALGKLTAGLTHELNNPAAAAARATAALRERIAGMRTKLAKLSDGHVPAGMLTALTALQEDFVARIGPAPELGALERADREDELGEWLEDHDVDRAWDLAGVFVAAGLGPDDLERVAAAVTPSSLPAALQWLSYTVETETLVAEIGESTARISALVDAAKQYSQIDRTPHQAAELHVGLDATLTMMSGKIGPGVTVVKEYDRSLPAVPAYAGELNQVWPNLIHNALDAMGGTGTLTLRTALDGDRALVEIGDTGPGIPEELRRRVFEPFFTTKPVGQGTGLGLDVSWRIVVTRHGGDLRVQSRPGDTRFQVRLPLEEPAAR